MINSQESYYKDTNIINLWLEKYPRS